MKSVGCRARCAMSLLLAFLLAVPSSPAFSWAFAESIPKKDPENSPCDFEGNISETTPRLLAQYNLPKGSKAGDWKTIVGSEPQGQPTAPPAPLPPSEYPGTFGEPEPTPPVAEPPKTPPPPEPSSPPATQPQAPAKVEVGPQGGQVPWQGGTVSLNVPPGALNRNVPITVQRPEIVFERDPDSNIGQDDVVQAATVELGPAGTIFASPVEVVMQIPAESLQRKARGDQLVIVVKSGDFLEEVTDYKIDNQGRAHFYLTHFSSPMVYIIGGMILVSFMAIGGRLIVSDSPHILIQPDNSDVQKFVHSGKVKLPTTINPSGPTDLGIDKTFEGTMGVFKTVNGGATMVNLKDGSEINCQDLTFLAASVLLGSKDSRFSDVKAVGGTATCGDYSGGHMWVEVKIDGKVYVVDTANPKRLMLIPAAEAYAQYILEPAFEFGHNSRRRSYIGWDGKPGPDKFDDGSSGPPPTPEQLKEMYKTGDEMGCRHQAESPDAIKEELREVYGKIKHPALKLKFREGYSKGADRCRPK